MLKSSNVNFYTRNITLILILVSFWHYIAVFVLKCLYILTHSHTLTPYSLTHLEREHYRHFCDVVNIKEHFEMSD